VATRLLDTQTLGRQFVDRYELMGEIASGGMATVYLARVTGVAGFQRLFALKRLHPHLQSEREFVQMFLDEARLAAGIHHPNVVPILEVGANPAVGYYLVMEFIEGETFARLLARAAQTRTRVPEAIAIRIMLDTLQGLHAAHELRDESGAPAGVVHRDVSPQNVLVGADGIARITDFGVARAASRLNATRAGQLKGKIAYMAPEQALGGEELDRRADVFASGVVLWEGLAQRRLFKAETEAATLARVLNEQIPSLAEVAPHVPPRIAEVVMRALERDLSRRYSTCAEFADALEQAAVASNLLASSRDLQGYMQRVLGGELEQERSAIRGWAAVAEGMPIPGPVTQSLTPSLGRTIPAITKETSGTTYGSGLYEDRRGATWGRALTFAGAVLVLAGGFVAYKVINRLSTDGGPEVAAGQPEGVAEPTSTKVELTPPPLPAPEPAVETITPTPAPAPAPAPGPEPVRPPASQPQKKVTKPKTESKAKSGADPLLDSNPYR
jgi:serine/threonine protein kinase